MAKRRGRPPDTERQALVEKLGLKETKHNYTKKELLEIEEVRAKKAAAKEAKLAENKALVEILAGDIPGDPTKEIIIPEDIVAYRGVDQFAGLTDNQKMIAQLRLRGMSVTVIANVMNVSQPYISKELRIIREWQGERGKNVNQAELVGNTTSLYEEVEHRAWEQYQMATEVSDKAKMLAVVMSAREKQTKLLMDLGLIKKAPSEVKVAVEVSPFLEKWNDKIAKKQFADTLIAHALPALEEPELDIEDAEIVEEDSEESGVELSTLEEPELDIEK